VRIARSYSRLGGLVAALLAVRLLLHAPEALAQVAGPDASGLDASLARAAGGLDAGSRDAAAPAMPDAGPARTPPQALFVPAVNWPESQPVPDSGRIEVLVVVELDGQARLEACEHPVAVCAALDAALALAEFAPARLAGEPIAARVQVRFALSRAPPAGAVDSDAVAPRPLATGLDAGVAPGATDSRQDASALGSAERDAARPETSEYGALARVERPKPLATALELEEIRELPGAMGDPFRAIEALPGVVPVMSGLPYVYVRGAPPSATAYFYDDIQMPALFHLALGPAVVHPAMVGGIDFYPGVAPARYGRKTGGVVAGKALLRDLKPGVHGEVELRLIDLQAYVATPVRKTGRLEIAGRFGYPGLLIKLFNSRSVVQYWDYQLRSVIPLSRDSEFMLIALGSFDLIGQRKNGHVQRDLELQFHRVEARLIKRARGLALGTALSAGFERSGIGQDVNVEALRLGPKLWLDLNLRAPRCASGPTCWPPSARSSTRPRAGPAPFRAARASSR
jgi:hypothetical protein